MGWCASSPFIRSFVSALMVHFQLFKLSSTSRTVHFCTCRPAKLAACRSVCLVSLWYLTSGQAAPSTTLTGFPLLLQDIRYIVLGVVIIISGFQYFNDYVLYNKVRGKMTEQAMFLAGCKGRPNNLEHPCHQEVSGF
jgi:hypothetical protein